MTNPTADAAKLLPCLKAFVEWAIRTGPWDGHDLDGGSIQEKAVELGILTQTIYDPAIHGEDADADVGDQWFVWSDLWNTRPQPAPPCEHEWETLHDGAIGCRKCYADKAVWEAVQERARPAPPEGEPDFEIYANHLAYEGPRIPNSGGKADTDWIFQRALEEFERMYRLGLAARPTIEDAVDDPDPWKRIEHWRKAAFAAAAKLAATEAELAKVDAALAIMDDFVQPNIDWPEW